jgi:hypothetical protein
MPTLTRLGTITYLLMLALASPVWAQAPAGAQKAQATETFSPAQTPAPSPSPATAPQPATTTPAEDTVVVRMIDAIDSSRDAQGKEYRAVVTKDASAGLTAIPKGSPAKIVLVRTASGWLTQLIAVNIYGSEAEVTSRSATVNGLVPGAAGGVVGIATGVLGGFGRKKASAPANPIASGEQVNLIPGTEVQFTLGSPQVPIPARRTSAPPVPAAPGTTRTRGGGELAK